MTDKKIAGPKASQNNPLSQDVNTPTPLLEIRKSASERIRINVKEYRGRTYVDLRCWYADDSGQFNPSAKGITLRPEYVAEVVQGLMLAARATGG